MAITVVVETNLKGTLQSLKSAGHAERGYVCAAVTAFVRSAARLIASDPAIAVHGSAPEAGVLRCEIDSKASLSPEKTQWLKGVTDFLVLGLSDLAQEYPEEVQLSLREMKRS